MYKLNCFAVAKVDLKNALSFPVNWDLYNEHLSSEEAILYQESSPDILSEVEKNVNVWLKIIERVWFQNSFICRESRVQIKISLSLLLFPRLLWRVNNFGEKLNILDPSRSSLIGEEFSLVFHPLWNISGLLIPNRLFGFCKDPNRV